MPVFLVTVRIIVYLLLLRRFCCIKMIKMSYRIIVW